MRGRRADVRGLTNFAGLPSGGIALLSLVVGFAVSLPFQTSAFGGDVAAATGLPVNSIAANVLHYADFAYIVGFVVAFVLYRLLARGSVRTA